MEGNYQLNFHSPVAQHGRVPLDHQRASASTHISPRTISPSLIDPALHSHRPIMMLDNTSLRPGNSPSPRQMRHGMKNLLSSPQMQRTGTPTSAVGRAAYSMSPPQTSSSIPRARHSIVDSVERDRPLPSPNVTDATIDSAYAQFIVYANPAIPHDVDTAELRKVFRSPPRSDGKLFNIFNLWQLVRKLEVGEFRTWSQLATQLGVEPPSAEKGQSAQKVQQYTVRLKRWMHAMHVDAFFAFLLGKPHKYYTQLPSAIGEGRDDVPTEEDLALRALMPEWRPKKGRRKAEDRELGVSAQEGPKRLRLETPASIASTETMGNHSVQFPQSAIPWSAFPDDPENRDMWCLASAMPLNDAHIPSSLVNPVLNPVDPRTHLQNLRQFRNLSPSRYPSSAILPGERSSNATPFQEPRSAVTPSQGGKGRSRRRHGPSVSSAWPNSKAILSGKYRGRPPNNRSTQDGPFSTFPARPQEDLAQATLVAPTIEVPTLATGTAVSDASIESTALGGKAARHAKLQLQVPQNSGRPIRLASPPIVAIEGTNGRLATPASALYSRRNSIDFFRNPEETGHYREDPQIEDFAKFSLEDVCNAFATQLLGAKMVGRLSALGIEEAKVISAKVVQSIAQADEGKTAPRALAMQCAILLGVEKEMGIGSAGTHSVNIRAFLQHSEDALEKSNHARASGGSSYDYTISLDRNIGVSVSSNMQIRDIVVPASAAAEDVNDAFRILRESHKGFMAAQELDRPVVMEPLTEADWKGRQEEVARREEKLRRLKLMMLSIIMSDE